MASLGPQTDAKANRTTLIMKIDDKEDYALCSLTLGKTEQQPLDLVFAQGEQISFQVEGSSSIHLTGYYLDDSADDFINDDEEDEDEIYSDEAEEDSQIEYDSEFDSEEYDESCSEEECTSKNGQPRIKRIETDESDLSNEESEDDSEENSENDSEAFVTADETDSDEEIDSDEEMESEEESSEEEENSSKPARSVHFDLPEAKKVKESPKSESKAPANLPQEPKKAQSPQNAQVQQNAKASEAPKAAPVKKTLPSGLQIEDLKLGSGPKVTQGKTVLIHYKGTLTNGKVFDSSNGKKPLKFKVGKNEVIKGMDMGIIGMHVGGSRKLVIPAPLAYGNQALPGIPKNSTLIFEIRVENLF